MRLLSQISFYTISPGTFLLYFMVPHGLSSYLCYTCHSYLAFVPDTHSR